MAKKKQLAGKKTKLAKLPLTQVLAGQGEETALWGSPSPGAADAAAQLSLTWEQAAEGAAGPLAQVYLHLVRELAALRSRLQPEAPPASGTPANPLPSGVPPAPRMLTVLRQAREGLLDLRRLLSLP